MEIDLKAPAVTISAELFQEIAEYFDNKGDITDTGHSNTELRLWGKLADAADVANIPYITRALAATVAPEAIEFERAAWGNR
jgi:hypothetical protein